MAGQGENFSKDGAGLAVQVQGLLQRPRQEVLCRAYIWVQVVCQGCLVGVCACVSWYNSVRVVLTCWKLKSEKNKNANKQQKKKTVKSQRKMFLALKKVFVFLPQKT